MDEAGNQIGSDAAREFNKIIISTEPPEIVYENDEAYVQISTVDKDDPYKGNLDNFIKNSKVDSKNNTLFYETSNGTQVVIPNRNLQASNFINKVIEKENRNIVLTETGIIAKSRAIELEDASKNLRDYSELQSTDISWENNRVKMANGQIDLSGGAILSGLVEPQIVGEKVRIPYRNRKGAESIYYFSLDQALKIIEASHTENLKGTEEKLNILKKKDIAIIKFNNPRVEDNLIVTDKLHIPKEYLEERYQIHKSIKPDNKSFTVSLYVKASGKPYKLDFNLEDYNNLLQQTA